MKNKIAKSTRFLAYLGRWQLSTYPMSLIMILAKLLGVLTNWKQVAIANLICAPFFWYIDKFIIVYLEKWLIKLWGWAKLFFKRKINELRQIFNKI